MTEQSKFILSSYGFDGKGGGEILSGDEISRQIKSEQLAWIHMDTNFPESRKWLEENISYLDPFITEALLAEETRPRMTQIGDGCLLFLRGVNLNKDSVPEDMVSIRLWVDKHRIISLTRRELFVVQEIKERLESGNGPKNSAEFICHLIGHLFQRMDFVLDNLDESTDIVEGKILEDASPSLREDIIDVRKKAIMFRRYMAPQRDAIEQLRMSDLNWISKINKRDLQESYHRVIKYVEDLDAIRERSQIVKDEIANMLADSLNKNIYTLSVIAAIFLPLGFLTGLLGVNIAGIPGVDSPNAFMHFCIMLSILVLVQIALFKKFKWF